MWYCDCHYFLNTPCLFLTSSIPKSVVSLSFEVTNRSARGQDGCRDFHRQLNANDLPGGLVSQQSWTVSRRKYTMPSHYGNPSVTELGCDVQARFVREIRALSSSAMIAVSLANDDVPRPGTGDATSDCAGRDGQCDRDNDGGGVAPTALPRFSTASRPPSRAIRAS